MASIAGFAKDCINSIARTYDYWKSATNTLYRDTRQFSRENETTNCVTKVLFHVKFPGMRWQVAYKIKRPPSQNFFSWRKFVFMFVLRHPENLTLNFGENGKKEDYLPSIELSELKYSSYFPQSSTNLLTMWNWLSGFPRYSPISSPDSVFNTAVRFRASSISFK